MTTIKNILVAVLLSVGLFGTAHAAEQTVKPMQAISFHAGSRHAVGYYLKDKRTCDLVLTLADDANYAPSRYEAAIEAGKSTRYAFTEGKVLQFDCQAEARSMTVESLEATAAN